MKSLKKIFLFVITVTVFVTCKKESLPQSDVVNQPVFSFSGTIAGNSVSWQAGVNNYYMYSSCRQNDTTGVYSFTGNLQNTTTTKNSIEIIINDYKVTKLNTSAASHIDTSLSATAKYFYNTGVATTITDTTGYTIMLAPIIYSGAATAYTYSWGDHTANTVIFSDSAVTHKYAAFGNYATSLKVNFTGCGTDSIDNSINLKNLNPLIISSVSAIVDSVIDTNLKITLTPVVSGGTAPYTYLWKFGDGGTSASAIPNHAYDTIAVNTYSGTLKVTDRVGNTATNNYVVQVNRSAAVCLYNYSMSKPTVDTTKTTNAYFLSDVTIVYTNGAGTVYTSKNVNQLGSSFKIISVSSYQSNINNEATKMLKISFDCMLYPLVSGPSPIEATNCTAIIAVAYK